MFFFQFLHIYYTQAFSPAFFSNVLTKFRLRPLARGSSRCHAVTMSRETERAVCTQPSKITASITGTSYLDDNKGPSSSRAHHFTKCSMTYHSPSADPYKMSAYKHDRHYRRVATTAQSTSTRTSLCV
jgi:hypothetical protein